MKLKDLNLKERDAVQSADGNVGVFDGVHIHLALAILGQRVWKPSELADDWSLLQPAPVLGEAVPLMKLSHGQNVIVHDYKHDLTYQGRCDRPGHVTFLSHYAQCEGFGVDGFSEEPVHTKFYIDPRPLPALPSEPSLPERITNYLTAGGLINPELAKHDVVRDLLMECRAALLGGSHDN